MFELSHLLTSPLIAGGIQTRRFGSCSRRRRLSLIRCQSANPLSANKRRSYQLEPTTSDELRNVLLPQLAFPMNPEGSTIEVMIEMDSIDGYARDVHAQIMALIPSELTSTGFITADEFVIMTKWLLKMRLDEIRRQRGIGCQEDHLDFGEIEMPWPLARAINAIGVTSVANNVVILVPTTPPAPLDKALYIRNSMTPMIFYRWYKCLAMLRLTKRPEWQPVFLSNNFDGGVFWALKVVNEKNEVPKNRHEKNLGIVASFSEISVEDVAMAVAVFLGVQFDPVSKDLHYQSRHPIGDVGAFRTALINNLPPHTSS